MGVYFFNLPIPNPVQIHEGFTIINIGGDVGILVQHFDDRERDYFWMFLDREEEIDKDFVQS